MKWLLNKAGIELIEEKIDALSERERRLLFVVSLLVLISLFAFLFWLSFYQTSLNNYRESLELENNSLLIKSEIKELKRLSEVDINYPYVSRVIKLEKELASQLKEIGDLTSDLMTPEKMSQAFRKILETKKILVNTMKNNPVEPISLDGESENFLFRHELVMDMNSRYLDSIAYIKKLEGQEWNIYWDEMDFTIVKYPIGKLTMKVHTLSNSERLIGL